MRPHLLYLLTLIVASTYAQTEPTRTSTVDEKAFIKLRGITYFYIDVSTSENRSEEFDLRSEIRDSLELELRRANITPKTIEGQFSEMTTPLLMIEVRFDRGLGRYNADVTLSIRDNATITRNKESVLAQSYSQSRRALGTSDSALYKEIKTRSREMILEVIEGVKRLK